MNADDKEPSEFGRGVVVCLAKFTEHLANRQAVSVANEIRYRRMTDEEKATEVREAEQHPRGDAAQRIASRLYSGILASLTRDAVSESLERWANGASDHFYDLDRERAPTPLCELADLTLDMGHGFRGQTWTEGDWTRIHDLWRAACLAVDEKLGAAPDWGKW